MTHARLTLTCTDCGHPFTLTAAVAAARRVRYPDQMLCQRCISARWLTGRGRYVADRLLGEEPDAAAGDGDGQESAAPTS